LRPDFGNGERHQNHGLNRERTMAIRREPFRVIVLTHGRIDGLLEQLLKLDGVKLAGVFLETDSGPRYTRRERLRRAIRYDGYATTTARLARKLLRRLGVPGASEEESVDGRTWVAGLAEARGIPIHVVNNFHAPDAIAAMRGAEADLGVVYGTNILKESVFKIPRLGSISLHQGLAPYYRGGPPVFWELYNGESELGLTVLFVESRVDTGAIVVQETVPLVYDACYGTDYASFIADYRSRLRGRCEQMVAEAVRLISEGRATPRPQDTSVGTRYRLPIKMEKDELRRRLRAMPRDTETACLTGRCKR
jgi:folate-dependent phosphoribosylglycinamide formyltransferase PurN